jgi:peptide/nickel transport system permease protein
MARFWQRFRLQRLGVAGAAFVVVLGVLGVAVPALVGLDPNEISSRVLLAPSLAHPFGTDELGRDVLIGIAHGIQVSLAVGLLAAVAATVIGTFVGAVAGFYGGLSDLGIMRITEAFQVMPSFILAAVIVALSGPGLSRVVAVIALLSWPQTARLMRAEVMRIKQLEFVDAVRCLGVPERTILAREIVPNAFIPVLAVGTLTVGHAILLETALSFFGLASPETVTWGRMLASGQRFLFNAWWLSFFPGMAIFLTVLAFNVLGDAIGSALSPRGGA